jgi:hypothetical protein
MNFENIKNILLFVNYIKFDPQSIIYFFKKKNFFQFHILVFDFYNNFCSRSFDYYLFFLLKFFIY